MAQGWMRFAVRLDVADVSAATLSVRGDIRLLERVVLQNIATTH